MRFRRPRQLTPEVARFGFDHGWLLLSPQFLNLGLPVLIVDHRLLRYGPAQLGLEPFGTRNPRLPLPPTRIVTELHPGPLLALWHVAGDLPGELLASHPADVSANPDGWPLLTAAASAAVLTVGDTYQIELGWAALFDGHIGTARLIDTTRPGTVETNIRDRRRRNGVRAA